MHIYNSALVGTIAFICTFGGVLFGMWLRTVLPQHHLDEESRDSIKVGIGLIATMTALVLGLITASAKSSYDAVETSVRASAVDILTLDRLLARYGPETRDIRRDLQIFVAQRIDMIWPPDASRRVQLGQMGSPTAAESLMGRLQALTPHTASQQALRAQALELAESLLKARWMVFAEARGSIPLPFLVILLFWLTLTFTSFGLFAPKNLTVIAVFFVCALSIGSALFLVFELESPFEGWLKIPPDTMRYALAHLNR